MKMHLIRTMSTKYGWSLAALALLVLPAACSLDPGPTPPLNGPSELALSIALSAQPDIINTDGVSTALITAEVRDPSGSPLPNRLVAFRMNGPGSLKSGFAITDGSGLARTIFVAPAGDGGNVCRTQLFQESASCTEVQARTVDNDFSTQDYRTVEIELRSPGP